MEVKSDIEIAQACAIKPIRDIAAVAGVDEEYLEYYGKYKAKIDLETAERPGGPPMEKLILVTAINPSPAGEARPPPLWVLADGMRRLGKIRLSPCGPLWGPVFGVKGARLAAATLSYPYGGHQPPLYRRLACYRRGQQPLAAMLDNHIQQGNTLDIDVGVSPGSAAWT